MIIRDKQELRRAVKQAVRRAEVVETSFRFDVHEGACGLESMLATWTEPTANMMQICAQGTPFCEQAAVMFAALDALEMPTYDLNKALAIEKGYDRSTYLSAILRAMHAKRVLVETDFRDADSLLLEDSRFAPLLKVDASSFVPERYGVPYEHIAQTLTEAIHLTNARDVKINTFDADALRYCMVPVCEDNHCILHVEFSHVTEITTFCNVLDSYPQVRVIASAPVEMENTLLEAAQGREQILVRLNTFEHFPQALAQLGTHFIPYASKATLPEEMLGRWIRAKERIWQALCEAYLPLARTGFELTTDMIENDVAMLMHENLRLLYI